MDEEKNVQDGTVSEDSGTESTETGTQETDSGTEQQPQPQPLTEERIHQIIAEQTDLARREIQSVKDKARSEVEAAQRRARLAETESAGYRSSFSGLDEETQRDVELRQLRGEKQYYQGLEVEEAQRRQFQQAIDTFHAQTNQFVTDLGIDPSDKRIDWGSHDEPLLQKQQRILASVAKIQKEDRKLSEGKLKEELEDFKKGIRKELNLDSVDTTQGSAVPGELTIEQLEKMSPEEKRARAAEIAKLPLIE